MSYSHFIDFCFIFLLHLILFAIVVVFNIPSFSGCATSTIDICIRNVEVFPNVVGKQEMINIKSSSRINEVRLIDIQDNIISKNRFNFNNIKIYSPNVSGTFIAIIKLGANYISKKIFVN